ncbi:MAG: hypothetical protein M0T75_00530 [Chloroflexi bacterium]|nr:hypothetical protein [Chloroflexota bacterium]
MTGPATPPPADDEVERRLAALKAGADPASFSPSPGARGRVEKPAAGEPDEPPALRGEVIEDGGRRPSPRGGPASGAGRGGAAGIPGLASAAGPGAGTRIVSWGITQAEAGRLGLWIGLVLVGFGGYLVLAQLVPGISLVGSLVLAILGGSLVAWHLAGRAGAWAVHGGAVLAGFGALRLVAAVADLPPAGWGTLGAGLGLLAIAVVRAARGEGIRWQAWAGGALALFGGWGVLGATIPGFPTLGDLVVPLVLVLVGVAVLRRGFRGS